MIPPFLKVVLETTKLTAGGFPAGPVEHPRYTQEGFLVISDALTNMLDLPENADLYREMSELDREEMIKNVHVSNGGDFTKSRSLTRALKDALQREREMIAREYAAWPGNRRPTN